MPGILVALEGPDGSGKTTQIPLLINALKEAGIESVVYSYPTHDKFYGKIIREQFLVGKIDLSPKEQVCLFLLDMLREKSEVQKDIDEGKVVFLDRYYLSTLAYQAASGFDMNKEKALIADFMELPKPNLVLYFDISANVSFERKAKQKKLKADRNENDLEFQKKVRNFYERLYKEGYGAKRWAKIDAGKRIPAVTKAAFDEIKTTYTGEINDSIGL